MSASSHPCPAQVAVVERTHQGPMVRLLAAWLGWTLDAFDFTVFLFIIVPIADEFKVPLTEVTDRLHADACGCVWSARPRRAGWPIASGADAPLMISILWYSFCNFIAGFSPTFLFLLIFRTLLGIGMGAEWPAGAALAMESWPTRSRGLMSGILQGSWGLGYALAAAANWLPLRRLRLARPVVDRHPAGVRRDLRPLLRQGAGGLGREQAPADGAEDGGQAAAVRHLQAQVHLQHADRPASGWPRPSASTTRSGRCSRPTCRRSCTGRRRRSSCRCSSPTWSCSPAARCGASSPTNGDAGRRSTFRPSSASS